MSTAGCTRSTNLWFLFTSNTSRLGSTEEMIRQRNLALACHRCNLHKGTNLVGRDPQTGRIAALFHPRQNAWSEHFAFCDGEIVGLTATGRTTASLLQMNTPDRTELRLRLIEAGLWR